MVMILPNIRKFLPDSAVVYYQKFCLCCCPQVANMAEPLSAPIPQARKKLGVTGLVQGVGFRPFVYRLARSHNLAGWVRNTSRGVEIEVEGEPSSLDLFVSQLSREAPALSRVEGVVSEDVTPLAQETFEILASENLPGAEAVIPPDVGLCPDCAREIRDPGDRRFQYPFTNCTNCGPRFTLIRQVPYDRPQTTMAAFEMCPACRREYEDPGDRRFHAEPTACPACGPQVWSARNTKPLPPQPDCSGKAKSWR
jgi:hydrogenase maturation protein HypF